MPAKKSTTNWKRLLQQDGAGTVILAKGAQSSEGNDGKFNNLQNLPTDKARMDAVMQMLEGNRKLHSMPRKKNPNYHPGLKGLFGGG